MTSSPQHPRDDRTDGLPVLGRLSSLLLSAAIRTLLRPAATRLKLPGRK